MVTFHSNTANQARSWFFVVKRTATPVQSGFRKQRSTTDQLVRLETSVREAFVNKQHAVATFFHIEKVYYTTWKYSIIKDIFDAGLRGRYPYSLEAFSKTDSSKYDSEHICLLCLIRKWVYHKAASFQLH